MGLPFLLEKNMYCVKCNSEKSEMKTKTKCMDCHRKDHAEYMRNFSLKPENKEKKQNIL